MSGRPVSAMYIMTVGVTFLLIPGFYLSWFKTRDNAVSLGDGQHDRTLSFDVCCALHDFDSMNLIFSFALKGAGDTRFCSL